MDFKTTKLQFAIPDGVIYLDGNSLGPLPIAAVDRLGRAVTGEWGEMLITAWNKAGWFEMPARLGDRIAPIIGAPKGSVMVGDTLSIKVFQALDVALAMRPKRRVVLSDNGNFPTDLYMAQGLLRRWGSDYELRVVSPEDVAEAITDEIAAVMLTHVDYRSGRMHDMAAITSRAHAQGAVMIWDLAHSAGAVALDLGGAEFACGCTYKYLNGGPGAPAFIYIRPDLIDAVDPLLSGWMGHDAPFAFDLDYRAGAGISRMRVGTPPVLQMAALDAALDIWDGMDMNALRARSVELSERLRLGVIAAIPEWELASPADPAVRGSQISFRHAEGYAITQALIARGVIGDFRAPDILRFGVTPLYLGEGDIDAAIAAMRAVMEGREYACPEYQAQNAVT